MKKETIKKVYYKKLVRDKIPQRIEMTGDKYFSKKLDTVGFKKELLRKIVEEADEIDNANTKAEMISEIGDLLDVINEIKKVFKISIKDLSDSRKKEFEKKGGFVKRIYLVWAENGHYIKKG